MAISSNKNLYNKSLFLIQSLTKVIFPYLILLISISFIYYFLPSDYSLTLEIKLYEKINMILMTPIKILFNGIRMVFPESKPSRFSKAASVHAGLHGHG